MFHPTLSHGIKFESPKSNQKTSNPFEMKISTYLKNRGKGYTLSPILRKMTINSSLFVLIFISSATCCFATDFYFSSNSGNDNYTAQQAQNPDTPWKSIDKLNQIAGSLRGGDRIFFKAGETFYGTIKAVRSGVEGAPILYTSYGSGPKPIITSFVRITDWTSIGNGNYQADISRYNLSAVQIVSLNGELQEIGRYPNSGSDNNGYLTITNANSHLSINTQSNPYSGSGGEVVIRKNNWVIDRHEISSIQGSSISFRDNGSQYGPQKGYGYFLQNHIALLDRRGEWSYDPASRRITVNLTGLNPSNAVVEVATLQSLVTNDQFIRSIHFSNLHLKGSNSHIININKSEDVKIQNCVIEFSGENGIHSFDVKKLIIQNNEIRHSLNNGIYLWYGTPGVVISQNSISHSMAFQGMAKSSDLAGVGIFLANDGNNAVIEKNQVTDTGFNGIHFGGNYTKIQNNFIDRFCLYKQDGGGIYTNSDGLRDRNNTGREITGNIILNGIGTRLGTLEEVDMAEGIYLDDNSSGVKVSNNSIAFMTGKGIYLHNANSIQVLDNLVYRTKSQLQFTHDNMGDPIRNLTVERNQFSSIDKSDYAYSVFSRLDDVGSLGKFSQNYFLDPFDNDFFILTKGASEGPIGTDRNLKNWSTNFGYDNNGVKPELGLKTVEVISSELIKESNFSSNSIVSGVYNATSQLLSSGIISGTLRVTPNSNNNATVYIQVGDVKKGDKIMFEFDMKGTPADIPLEFFLETTYNSDNGRGNLKASTKTEVKNHQLILTAGAASNNESLVIRMPNTAKEVLFDNFKVSKVTVKELDKEQFLFFDYNNSASAVQRSINGTFKNAKNETFTNVVTIPPYGAVMLAKIGPGTEEKVTNQPPTVTISNPVQNQNFIRGSQKVQLVAKPSDPEGQIKQVEFYNWDVLVETVTAPPYTFDWANIEEGKYQVVAKVIDAGDLSATSAPVNFTVQEPQAAAAPAPLRIAMTSPKNNQSYTLGEESVLLKANVPSSTNPIQKVEFFNWGYPVVTVTAAPYEFNWNRIETGNYKITARVTDSEGNVAETAAITFSVNPSLVSRSPQASMASPSPGQKFTLGQQTVKLKAQLGTSTAIQKVEFFNWGFPLVSVSRAPFEFDWTRIELGDYKVYAVITDVNGRTSTTEEVSFSVGQGLGQKSASFASSELPITMVLPANNQVFELGKQPVLLKAQAFEEVEKVEFINWGFPLVTTTNPEHEFSWSKIELGEYMVSARITDSQGNVHDSEPVWFKVVPPANTRTMNTDTTTTDTTVAQMAIMVNLADSISKKGEELVITEKETREPLQYGLKFGPNPTNSALNIYFQDYPQDREVQVSIIDMTGVERYSYDFNTSDGTLRLDVSGLNPGVHLIRTTFDNQIVQTSKFIKL